MRQKTNDALRKQQSMPNDAALYIDGIGNRFIAFTCSFEDFCVRTLVFWSMVSMITGFACREGSIKKHCGRHAPSKLIRTHRLAI
jgi:hypothetical protein